MHLIYCPQCRAKANPSDKFCVRCGAPLSGVAAEPDVSRSQYLAEGQQKRSRTMFEFLAQRWSRMKIAADARRSMTVVPASPADPQNPPSSETPAIDRTRVEMEPKGRRQTLAVTKTMASRFKLDPEFRVTSARKISSTIQESQSAEPVLVEPMASVQPSDVGKLKALLQRIQELEEERNQAKNELWRAKVRPSKLSAMLMLAVGAVALVHAALYAETVVAFIGLGLTFWGGLLLQARPTGYLKRELVESVLLAPLKSMDRLLSGLGFSGKGIYLPAEEPENILVFVPAQSQEAMPSSSPDGKQILDTSTIGVSLVPPGLSLANLLREGLGVDTNNTNLQNLEPKLARALIEDLEIVKDVQMSSNGDKVLFNFNGLVISELCKELREDTTVCSVTGCPICSAVGCTLAGLTGSPVSFEGETLSPDGLNMQATYRILREA